MQCQRILVLALATLAVCHGEVGTPMEGVVTLLTNMHAKIEETGRAEQTSYDKYSCWCEETLAGKAADISKAKDDIEVHENNIVAGKGRLGAGAAKITNLKQDIADNIKSVTDATEMRTAGNAAYMKGRTGSEAAIAAMEEAIGVLANAGSLKATTKFLQNVETAKVMSVINGVRPVLQMTPAKHMKNDDREMIERFIKNPEIFFKAPPSSALQTDADEKNPFGDFAPASTQIQGILKSMYDDFVGSLESSDADEANAQENHESLMATKASEYKTLTGDLDKEKIDFASQTRAVAVAKRERDETQEHLNSQEESFGSTTEGCKTKAKQWSERSRARSKEVSGIQEAIGILDAGAAKKTFEAATKAKTFLQVSATNHQSHARGEAYKTLKKLAAKHHSLQIAQIAVSLKNKGEFDPIIKKVVKMEDTLRAEAAVDVGHRDRCQEKENANKNDIDDAGLRIKAMQAEMKRINELKKAKQEKVDEHKANMKSTQKEIDDITRFRKQEADAYSTSTTNEKESIRLLTQAKVVLGKFYKDLVLVQVGGDGDDAPKKEPAKEAPRTTFDNGADKASTGEATGIIAILDMLVEDMQQEMVKGTKVELEAQAGFAKAKGELDEIYEALSKAKAKATVDVAALGTEYQEAEQNKDAAGEDLSDAKKLKIAIATDCKWVKTHFKPRQVEREAEMGGLVEAEEFLAGVGTENDLSFPEEEKK